MSNLSLLSVVLLVGLTGCRTECRTLPPGAGPSVIPAKPVSCPVVLPPDTFAMERADCRFGPGSTAQDTLGVSLELAKSIPIQHVIVVMRENRSFDHILGRLHEQGQPLTDPAPASFTNVDARGEVVPRFHSDSTCATGNAPHQWQGMHRGVNGGALDGFVRNASMAPANDGHYAMSFYDESDLPFETWLAKTWALNDRHFSSVRSGTFPNRDFLLLGTSDGIRETGIWAYPNPTLPTIFSQLDKAGLTWATYGDELPLSDALGWNIDHQGCFCLSELFKRLDEGTLPNVVFVDAISDFDDDHPPADLQRGEAWMREIYQHAVNSPQWPQLALIWTYDEAGGFADHVPPPERACVARPGDEAFIALGPRVPFVVVSPYAKPNSVSHVIQEHTAITRFIETIFGLPALTRRDANSPALLDMFDFSCDPPLLHPPPAPLAGTGGCH